MCIAGNLENFEFDRLDSSSTVATPLRFQLSCFLIKLQQQRSKIVAGDTNNLHTKYLNVGLGSATKSVEIRLLKF